MSYEIWSSHAEWPYHQDMCKIPFSIDWYTELLTTAYERYYKYEKRRIAYLDAGNSEDIDLYDKALENTQRYLILVDYIRYRISMIDKYHTDLLSDKISNSVE